MKLVITALSLPLLLLAGCVTTRTTAEQRARCQEMESAMGIHTAHDHAETKGMGRSSMNLTHDQCRQILAQPR